MKKILFILLIIPFLCSAQKANFKLQSDASFLLENGNKFYVIETEGTQSDLYKKVLSSITKIYVSPKNVISKVENDMISVNGISDDFFTYSGMMGVKIPISMQYNLQFQFKDGKIRIDAPTLIRIFTDSNQDIKPISGWLNAQGVFKKGNANPKKQYVIDAFNNELNGLINSILDFKAEEKW